MAAIRIYPRASQAGCTVPERYEIPLPEITSKTSFFKEGLQQVGSREQKEGVGEKMGYRERETVLKFLGRKISNNCSAWPS